MKNIVVTINSKDQVIAVANVVTKDGIPTVIKAQNKVNYEFIDQALGRAPKHIVTKRQGKDLHISFEENSDVSDLIIEDFYDNEGALIGLNEAGQYQYYMPDTGKLIDHVTQLQAGDIEGQVLAGNALIAPWWIAEVAGSSMLPWLAGLAGVALAGAALSKTTNDNTPMTQPPSNETPSVANPTISTDKGSATIIPATSATGVTINYIDEAGKPQSITISKKPDGTWAAVDKGGNAIATTPSTNKPSIDINTGKVVVPAPAIKDNSQITASQTTPNGQSDSATAQVGAPEPITTTPPSQPQPSPAPSTGGIGKPAPVAVIAKEDGSATVTPALNATTVNINFTNENGTPVNLVVSKDSTGNWVAPNAPQGVVVNPATGVVTIPAPAIKDGSTIVGTQTTPQGVGPVANAVVDGSPVSVDLVDGGKKVVISTADNATSVTVNYTDANGNPQTVTMDKTTNAKGEKVWAVKSPIEESKGDLEIPADAIKPGTVVTATQTTPIRSTTDSATIIDLPNVDAKEDGSVTITPTKDATSVTVNFTDEANQPIEVVATKGPNGKWTIPENAPENVSVNPDTGAITIPADNVADGKPVTATQTTPNGTSDPVKVTTPAAPVDVAANPADGSVTVTPAPTAEKVVVEFKDEKDQPVTVTASKDPATGEWTIPQDTQAGVEIDPKTGKITIPAANAKDGEPVKATQTGPNGQETTDQVTAPTNPAAPADPVKEVKVTEVTEVYEALLPRGSKNTGDAKNATTVSKGQFSVTGYGDDPQVSLASTAGMPTKTANNGDITWTWSAETNTLTGLVPRTNATIATIALEKGGNGVYTYTTTLNQALMHKTAEGRNTLDFDLAIQVNGNPVTVVKDASVANKSMVSVVDDMPVVPGNNDPVVQDIDHHMIVATDIKMGFEGYRYGNDYTTKPIIFGDQSSPNSESKVKPQNLDGDTYWDKLTWNPTGANRPGIEVTDKDVAQVVDLGEGLNLGTFIHHNYGTQDSFLTNTQFVIEAKISIGGSEPKDVKLAFDTYVIETNPNSTQEKLGAVQDDFIYFPRTSQIIDIDGAKYEVSLHGFGGQATTETQRITNLANSNKFALRNPEWATLMDGASTPDAVKARLEQLGGVIIQSPEKKI